MASKGAKVPIQSTAGAIPIMNDKGEVSMEKVKVARYVTGKRPDYAPQSSDEEDEDLEVRIRKKRQQVSVTKVTEREVLASDGDEERNSPPEQEDEEDRHARLRRRRLVAEPEILDRSSESSSDEDEQEKVDRRRRIQTMGESDESEEELSEDEIERRRNLIRQKARTARQEEELMAVGEESEASGASSSEYESEFESEEEETGPRLRPIFVRKKDRVTIQEREKEERRQQELEVEAKRMQEERRKQTLRIVADTVKKEVQESQSLAGGEEALLAVVNTDDENDEEEYEAWKVRELRRMKRDKEEREAIEKEKLEVERLRHMTEEERREVAKKNPRHVTNQAQKGKYKFLQKYYHRGAFFLDNEDDLYKRDYSNPTLEDHFDKTVLPKVMQVKNFGRSGRTKYTHLVDQDTTQYDSPWNGDSALNLKYQNSRGGGMKQVFDRPSNKKQK